MHTDWRSIVSIHFLRNLLARNCNTVKTNQVSPEMSFIFLNPSVLEMLRYKVLFFPCRILALALLDTLDVSLPWGPLCHLLATFWMPPGMDDMRLLTFLCRQQKQYEKAGV